MSKFSSFMGVAAVAVFATTAFGDDPALFQPGTGCSGTYWCASTGVGLDPVTGDDTLEFKFITSSGAGHQGIVQFTPSETGWVAYETGSTVDNLLDFEVIGGEDVVFLYCGNNYCSSSDVGLPSVSNPAVAAAITAAEASAIQWANPNPSPYPDAGSTSPIYSPTTSSQPGNAVSYFSNSASASTTQYAVVNNPPYVSAAEPSAALLLASMMIALAAFVRWKFSAGA